MYGEARVGVARWRTGGVLVGGGRAGDLRAGEDSGALEIRVRVGTEDGGAGVGGVVTDLLESALEGPMGGVDSPGSGRRVYVCGPTAMMRRCAEIASRRKVPCIAALETTMACGFGVCLGCAAPLQEGGYALVCRDGPAFDAASIDWERLP